MCRVIYHALWFHHDETSFSRAEFYHLCLYFSCYIHWHFNAQKSFTLLAYTRAALIFRAIQWVLAGSTMSISPGNDSVVAIVNHPAISPNPRTSPRDTTTASYHGLRSSHDSATRTKRCLFAPPRVERRLLRCRIHRIKGRSRLSQEQGNGHLRDLGPGGCRFD